MASENETVEKVLSEIYDAYGTWKRSEVASLPTQYLKEWHDRIEAAHQREVAELRECLREAVTEVCNRLEKCGFKEPCVCKTCYVQKWRKALKDEGGEK